ncbi:hypothetical protein ACVWU4_001010 [Campylobacter coli]
MNKEKREQIVKQNTVSHFLNILHGIERSENDLDLVFLVLKELEANKTFLTKSKFEQNKLISSIRNSPSEIQRVLLNKYFINLLLKFRNIEDIPVIDIIICLTNDGPIEAWLDYFRKGVLPFIIKHNVIEKV